MGLNLLPANSKSFVSPEGYSISRQLHIVRDLMAKQKDMQVQTFKNAIQKRDPHSSGEINDAVIDFLQIYTAVYNKSDVI